MARLFPDLANIDRLTVAPTNGERHLLACLAEALNDDHEVFFNPYLDGDRPDIIVLKRGCGAAVIEVKDWNLSNHRIRANNTWYCKEARVRSPQQQAFRYKENLYNLHLPVLGLGELRNPGFYSLVSVYVYFHDAARSDLDRLYEPARHEVREHIRELNRSVCTRGTQPHERQLRALNRRLWKLDRDRAMCWGRDTLRWRLADLARLEPDDRFTDEIYEEFKRRLLPPQHVLKQGLHIDFDSRQAPLTASRPGLCRIRGVAGCGKTTILAKRAIGACARHDGQVLILTFNITLRNHIRDTISRLQRRGAGGRFDIIHYHGFINAQLSEHGIDTSAVLQAQGQPAGSCIDAIYGMTDLFDGCATERFQTILVDEVQDYRPEWVEIIRKYFLADGGEMVLFGEQSQNIYQRPPTGSQPSIGHGFGRWHGLTTPYRSRADTALVRLHQAFQRQHLVGKYADSEIVESLPAAQGLLQYELLAYDSWGPAYDPRRVIETIDRCIREFALHPNDIAIISSRLDYLVPLNEAIRRREKTTVMFEETEELAVIEHLGPGSAEHRMALERIRRRKKTFFMQNAGLIKLSTIHSFKGHEAQTVFCILAPEDTAEVVYTGITRASANLVVFGPRGGRFEPLLRAQMAPVDAEVLAA